LSITTEIIRYIEQSDEIQSRMHQQEALEDRMRSMGVDRYWNAVSRSKEKERETHTQPGRKLLGYSVVALSAAIEEWLKTAKSGGAGRRNDAVRFIEQIDTDSAAMICARTVLDSGSSKRMMS